MEELEIQAIESKKRSLKRYKKNLAKLSRLEEKLHILEERITSVRSPNYSGMPRGGTPVTLADLLADKIELEERIANQKEINREYKRAITKELDQLDNVKHIEVLELFFIDGLTPEEIAEELCYNVRTVYRLYSEGVKLLTELDYNNTTSQ